MMMKKTVFLILILILFRPAAYADEGMWIPLLLKKYTIEEMQRKGFKLTAEDIYDINRASLKDAVVGLGNLNYPFSHFCTGEIVSGRGLMFTNYHCAHSMVQSHTSLEHNYLRDGFLAGDGKEELANPGITASILVYIEDVTEMINSALNDDMSPEERKKAIKRVSARVEAKAVAGTNLMARVSPYFNGNQYFLSVYKIYRDVRLVAAPPAAVGKFGGDTDNWAWPRHTGDFAVLRIYAGADNEPADYSPHNKPYVPKQFLKISLKPKKKGDFTFVFGYPGTTEEYLPSFAIEEILERVNPHKIGIRTQKLDIINAAMEKDEALRIKYSAKAASVANAWKKWQGESKGLVRYRTVENKRALETAFNQWAAGKPEYSGVVERYRTLYEKRAKLMPYSAYLSEAAVRGAEVVNFALNMWYAIRDYDKIEDVDAFKRRLEEFAEGFYKDWDYDTDMEIMKKMFEICNSNLEGGYLPEAIARMDRKGISRAVNKVFEKSLLTHPEKFKTFIRNLNEKSPSKLKKDPLIIVANSVYDKSNALNSVLNSVKAELNTVNRLWMKGLMEMYPDRNFWPDANSTLRVSYGVIDGYRPVDGTVYDFRTTLEGVMEKENPEIYDYQVPEGLKSLYIARDYGRYADEDGKLPICFLASNHTTGGNSGSPVLDAEGRLIGINFDRSWDGVMSDMQYEPEICRNIAVDIRFVLFMLDKYAGASHLIREMTIEE